MDYPEFIVIVGLGKTGFSCAEHLAYLDVPFAITDSREEPPDYELFKSRYPDIEVSVGKFDLPLMLQAKALMVSQGVPLNTPEIVACKEKNIPLIGDIELFVRRAKAPIVAITGSNAKSTVTTLVGDMAKQAGRQVLVGGNIGTPALELLKQEKPEFYVIEMSNFQLETTYSLSAEVACILNISPDHLDCYNHFDEYVAAKRRIYHACKKAVINRDDKLTWLKDDTVDIISFGAEEPTLKEFGIRSQNEEFFLAYENENLLNVKELKVVGQQNWLNALSALAIGQHMGLPMSDMLQALKQFVGLPHRCEWVAEYNDVNWYNDSKGTNVGATVAAIEGIGSQISGKIILIAGGMAKDADFSPLLPVVEKYVKTAILFGQDAIKLERTFINVNDELIQSESLEEAVWAAKLQAQPGDAILLSPACSSFDMFQNFEHRGEVFCQTVRELLHEFS